MDDDELRRRWQISLGDKAPGEVRPAETLYADAEGDPGVPAAREAWTAGAAETMVPELLDEDDEDDEDSIRTVTEGAATEVVAAADGLIMGPLLGEGGAAQVFLADQVSLRREVAVKVVRNRSSRRSFVAESRITGRLDHPNILPVHDLVPLGDGAPAMVMKRVVGRSWREHLDLARDEGRLELVDELRTFVAVCNAIAFAHANGVLHLDLKPANVMVGDFGEVLVTDWGCAVVMDDRGRWDDQPSLPRAASIDRPFGTPAYMPPELARGEGAEVGPHSDIYLLGGVLYDLLAGRPPRRGPDVMEIVREAADGVVAALPEDAPELLTRLVQRCLATAPADRPPTVIDVRDTVLHWLDTRESRRIVTQAYRRLAGIEAEIAGLAVLSVDGEGPGERLLEVIGAFAQARQLWPDHPTAEAGEREARRLSAERALSRGEPGLAEAQALHLPADDPERKRLIEAADEVRRQGERERRQARALRWGLGITAVALLVTAAVSLVLIEAERVEAKRAADAAAEEVRQLREPGAVRVPTP